MWIIYNIDLKAWYSISKGWTYNKDEATQYPTKWSNLLKGEEWQEVVKTKI